MGKHKIELLFGDWMLFFLPQGKKKRKEGFEKGES